MSVAGGEGRGKDGFASALLDWYDDHARILPWRVPPGSDERPDPYRVWLSEVMLQQTTVATVRPRFERFLERWPTVSDLAAAPQEDVLSEWAGLGYYARARNLHACAKVVAEQGWPQTEEGLRALPGLGTYTAAAVAAIALAERAVVIDGNVERVVARIFAIERPVRQAGAEVRAGAAALTPAARPGDYAQAMMDLGAGVCRPKRPDCLLCPVRPFCDAAARGLTEELPVRVPKKPRPVRSGVVYVGVRPDGAVLCERRAENGLYGGMLGLPSSDWKEGGADAGAPVASDWVNVGEVEHGLTHFILKLTVQTARLGDAPSGTFFTDDLSGLPTVFRRCVALASVHAAANDAP
ncbi:A/G-specific adenine glycosylase [Parvularcula dongshanensis]|uniref:Adenine DNA glycosylase n=1 Tax=Parvularcula dongshanensis TaxID=1173995 RepID=A0A840I2T7_9PROT|nr:A/G-specific adenine glycosylase [Parvularcula dongshanensis]MBB4658612.1 A/G-specific adenine glycosylase [Parvularcula dongshanensis]